MNEEDFEGTQVLERLMEIGRLDEFFEAVDRDDLRTARDLMGVAQIDHATIAAVLQKMQDPDGDH